MRYDNPTIREIERKVKDISDCPEYHLATRESLLHSLRKRDAVISFLMEHPKFQDPDERRGKTKIIRNGIKRLEDAWRYARGIPNIVELLTSESLIKVGRIIDPRNQGFRNVRVSLNLPNYTPPNPLKVPELVEDFLGRIKAKDLHPIESAALVHLGVAAIQPFVDGNKRTGRVLQNKILYEQELPPASIPIGERQYYIGLLEGAMGAYRNGDTKGQGPFFNYIAAKANVSLDHILRNLQEGNFCENCFVSTIGKKKK